MFKYEKLLLYRGYNQHSLSPIRQAGHKISKPNSFNFICTFGHLVTIPSIRKTKTSNLD